MSLYGYRLNSVYGDKLCINGMSRPDATSAAQWLHERIRLDRHIGPQGYLSLRRLLPRVCISTPLLIAFNINLKPRHTQGKGISFMSESIETFYPNDLDAVLLMIREYAVRNKLTPKQLGEMFTEGIAAVAKERKGGLD